MSENVNEGPSMAPSQENEIPKKSRVARGGSKLSDRKPRENKRKAAGSGTTNEEDDEDECVICADKITYAAVTPCNHTTCHKCTFRQRALYE